MPEIKNTFLGGKMNKDLDERLLPKNEYRDALNVDVSTSQGDDVGSLQNTWGNTAYSNISNVITGAQCIGSTVDRENEKIYWFIKGTNTHAIAEYDIKLKTTTPVLVDFGMADTYTQTFSSIDLNPNSSETNVEDDTSVTWNHTDTPNVSTTEGTAWYIANNEVTPVSGKAGFMKLFLDEINLVAGYKYEIQYDVTHVDPVAADNITYSFYLDGHGLEDTNVVLDASSTGTKTVEWIQGGNSERNNGVWLYHNSINSVNTIPFKIDNVLIRQADRFLNFDNVGHITAINVLDGMLFWTDGVNEPKKINIQRCKAGSNSVVNFNSTSFVGPELITNGTFATNDEWVYDSAFWTHTSGYMVSVENLTSNQVFVGIEQTNVSIERGKTYAITVEVGGSSGLLPTSPHNRFGPTIVDEFGGWTRPVSGLATSYGTYTWALTAGETNDTMSSNQNAGYTSSSFNFSNFNEGAATLPHGITIDNISIKEIAVDWNATTKVKDASGVYTRNIKEDDITLIKKYPLNAPSMELINTTKPSGSVIETTCFSPFNTTHRGGIMSSSSGDVIRYRNFTHLTIQSDVIAPVNLPKNVYNDGPAPVQIDVGGYDYWANNIGTAQDGSLINYPLWEDENDPHNIKQNLGVQPIISNDFTKRADYYKRAWQTWAGRDPLFHDHVYFMQQGGKWGFGSATVVKDLIGGRLWLNDKNSAQVSVSASTVGAKNNRLVLGGWPSHYNNLSFWTYMGNNGEKLIKPPGTHSTRFNIQSDGTVLFDNKNSAGALKEAVVLDATEKYTNSSGDFGAGWSVVDGKYVGNAHTTTGDEFHASNAAYLGFTSARTIKVNVLGGSSGTTFVVDSVPTEVVAGCFIIDSTSAVAVGTHITDITSTTITINTAHSFADNEVLTISAAPTHDGIQRIHNVITNINPGASSDYVLSMTVKIIDPGPIPYSTQAIGTNISALSTENSGPFGIDYKNSDAEAMFAIGQGAFGKNTTFYDPGVYPKTYNWKLTMNDATAGGGMSFWKRNGAVVEISGITIRTIQSAPVRIQPLVFEPKPDYEEGDVVKLTNSSKAPNGDDVTVTVKLGEEYTLGRQDELRAFGYNDPKFSGEFTNTDGTALNAPKSWADDITIGAEMGVDNDFNSDHSVGTLTFESGSVATSVGTDLNTQGGTNCADWTTSLEMLKNTEFQEADPADPNKAKYWQVLKPKDASGANLPSGQAPLADGSEAPDWVWHDAFDAGTLALEIHPRGTTAGWDMVKQNAFDNSRIFYEMNGLYKFTITMSNFTFTGSTNAGISAHPFTGTNTDLTTRINANGTNSEDAKVDYSPHNYTSPDWQNYGAQFRIRANGSHTYSYNTTSARITKASFLANEGKNRVKWGSVTGDCRVITGTTSQIIAHPANPNGTQAGGGTFVLTEGEYYVMRYQVDATNYTGDQAADVSNGNFIKLFDHDWFGKISADSPTSYTTGGHVLLDNSVGVHHVTWKQSHTKNQLEICFGPGFEGQLDNVYCYPLIINKEDYGAPVSNDQRKIFDAEIVDIDSNLLQIPLVDHRYWEASLVDEEPIFKDVFPRFAYRWKYKDGEYSAMSAFTEVAFLPDNDYNYNANEGYNISMENNVRRIILNHFEKPSQEVVELDILYKESNSNNIYTFKTVKGSELIDFTDYTITKEKFHALVESKQLLRPYDNVPRKAVAQEITANRIIFGNYVQQYDISPSDEPIITTRLITTGLIPSEESSKSIKSIRQYQVGVSYLDAFGRQSPVFSNDNALLKIDQRNSGTANDIKATLDNFPPDWVTHYKYFVKDISEPFYNVSLDRFWQAERSDHVWLSFPSSDYNKLKEDDYIILKKPHDGNDAVVEDITVKYKVLARKSEAPDFIKITRKSIGGRIFDVDGSGLEFFSQSSYGGSAGNYPQVGKTTFSIKGNVVEYNQAFKEAVLDDQTGRYVRLGQEINNKPSVFSNYYEILHISRTDFGTNVDDDAFKGIEDPWQITLVQPLGLDASFVGSGFSSSKKLFIEYYREELNEYDNNFEGKFFIKIARDNFFDKYIGQKQRVQDSGYNIVNAQDTHWAHAYWNSAAQNTNADRGQDTDSYLYDRNNFEWKTSSSVSGYTNSANSTAGIAGGVGVPPFPSLNETTIDIDTTSNFQNKYLQSLAGTVTKNGWEELASGTSTLTQKFIIDQAWSWRWGLDRKAYIGQNTDNENCRFGSGFVMGNSYCSFAFHGIGDVDPGENHTAGAGVENITFTTNTDGEEIPDEAFDTNTWYDGSGKELSATWFDNFELLTQLKKSGTQFRWLDDPSQTVYTIVNVNQSAAVQRYHAEKPDGSDYGSQISTANAWGSSGMKKLDKSKANYGYRIDLQLDRPIVWSPTATIASGSGWNTGGNHTTVVPFKNDVAGTTAQIQIVEKRPSEGTYTSFNPAVFEVVPKERADLNLYYETAETGMVLKDGMYIEALNNKTTNDSTYGASGGNYNSDIDTGTVYLPGGEPAVPYALALGNELVTNHDFSSTYTDGWTLDTATGFTATQDIALNTVTINATTSSGQFPNLRSDLIVLEDGARYRIVVDVESLNNDIGEIGATPPTTKTFVWGGGGIGGDHNYYPMPSSFPPITTGVGIWEFTHDASSNNNSNNVKILIQLSNTSPGTYEKQIVLNKVSLKKIDGFDYNKPILQIQTGEKYSWCDKPNKIQLNPYIYSNTILSEVYSVSQDLPAGITLRISERDAYGNAIYSKDYTLLEEKLVGDVEAMELQSGSLKWHNCFAFGNGVESHRLRDDFNATTIDKGPRVSTTLEESYKEEALGSSMIFSGIYNSISSVNQLNQFIQADSITKELNPEYGAIQKLFTRNTNIVAFCENKILKVLANKDALYNAEGKMQVTHSNKVLGSAIPFVGEYGISKNPESFANFGYRVYFTDKDRGAVLRLSADGLTPISDKDMVSYFKQNLSNSNAIIGSYDEDKDSYNLTLDDTSVCFSEKVNGWTSFKSFLAESGVSINGDYYTWKGGDIWKHHTKALRNSFYNTQYESSVKLVFNDLVDEIKNFNTLNYEGSTSRVYEDRPSEEDQIITKGWYANYVKTDLEQAEVVNFKDKEGKWFNNITGITKTASNIDLKDFTSQGLGFAGGIDSGFHANYKTLCIKALLPVSIPEVNAIGGKSAGVGYHYSNNGSIIYPAGDTLHSPGLIYVEDAGYDSLTGFEVQSRNQIRFEEHDYDATPDSSSLTAAQIQLKLDNPYAWSIEGVVDNLIPGNTYVAEADVEITSNPHDKYVGFTAWNITFPSGQYGIDYQTRRTKSSGKIFMTFTYTPDAFGIQYNHGVGVMKEYGTAGTIKNISCIDVTPKSDELTYTVNTSPNDRTQTTTKIEENYEAGGQSTITEAKEFYIHANTVNGIKYAVSAGQFSVTSSLANVQVLGLQDIGTGTSTAGYYNNVIQVTVMVAFAPQLFPNKDIESYLNIQGTSTLAIDQ